MAERDIPRVCVIGVGNELLGDDAAGRAVARRLRSRLANGVRIIESDGDGTALIDAWQGAETVVLIDAVRSGAPPGTIHRFDAGTAPVPARLFHYSTHAVNVADAVELSRALGTLPPCVIVYGIEAGRFDAGAGLSPEVERAVEDVAERVQQEVGSLAGTEV